MSGVDSETVVPEGLAGTIVICQSGGGKVHVHAVLRGETLWLTQKQIAGLFDTTKQNVSAHLMRIFEEGELAESSVVNYWLTTAQDGKSYLTKHYNLDVVIAVGYRINSKLATSFRIWATQVLREYIIKGFAIDDKRMRDPGYFLGKDYFEEMLERIGEIRASNRSFSQKITDIYARCSVDYHFESDITHKFYSSVYDRSKMVASSGAATDGLACAAVGTVTMNGSETIEEREPLERWVFKYLDFAEDQSRKGIPMTMSDWKKRLDVLMQFSNEELMMDPQGLVSNAVADALADEQSRTY